MGVGGAWPLKGVLGLPPLPLLCFPPPAVRRAAPSTARSHHDVL